MADAQPTVERCSQCGDVLGDSTFRSTDGPICKWCQSEREVKRQQASAPARQAGYAAPMNSGTGLSTTAIIRIVALGVMFLLFIARHC